MTGTGKIHFLRHKDHLESTFSPHLISFSIHSIDTPIAEKLTLYNGYIISALQLDPWRIC